MPTTMPMERVLYVVAGEVSGDTHAAALLEAFLEGAGDGEASPWRLAGLGGPRMAALAPQTTQAPQDLGSGGGPGIEDWLDEAAVLGLWEVLRKYSYFKAKLEATVAEILETRPAGVLLVDYPGFNLRLAARLRRAGYAGRLLYYISPQVWAWKRGRIRTMAAQLDLMICIFPFEKELYEASGLPTVFAGHPLVDELAELRDPAIERDPDLVALLPGSREREIAKLFPPMLDAAALLLRERPGLRFATCGANDALTARLQSMVHERGLEAAFDVGTESSQRIMQRAGAGAVASGTATLEAACLGLPYCLVYKVAWLTAAVARRVMSVRYLGIVNVLAGREVVKELLQGDAEGARIAAELGRLLDGSPPRETLLREMAEAVASLGGGGCHRRAAEAVREALEPDAGG